MENINSWDIIVSILDFAFQPIVDSNTGKLYGVEALLRNYKYAGFDTICRVFDTAYSDDYLYTLDLKLREKAIKKFNKLPFSKDIKLFYNLDNRVLEMPNFTFGNTETLLDKEGLQKNSLVFEISEKYNFTCPEAVHELLSAYKNQGYNMAIDDYGSGYSNMQKLYHIEVDILKIDRFFIADIGKCPKKSLFVKNIVNLVHSLGGLVVAEGIETVQEFFMCQRIKCDLIQGYYIAHPTQDIKEIKASYTHFKELQEENLKTKKAIENYLLYEKPLQLESSFEEFLDTFLTNETLEFVPIVDNQNRPLGIIDFKKFGRYFLKNCNTSTNINEFVEKVFTLDINFTLNKITEYLNLDSLNVIFITDKGKYIGFLDKTAIIKVITEKTVVEARSQNPLTKLHGNLMVYDFIKNSLENLNDSFAFIYFDFNSFKIFNDKYGFKLGDEVIILFSELLRETFRKPKDFIGHIGGDDFFIGLNYSNYGDFNKIYNFIEILCFVFTERVKSYYENDFNPISPITIASVILEVPFEREPYTLDDISKILFKLKKESKGRGNYINSSSLLRNNNLLKLGGYL